jgi:hypothetical protein
MSVTLQSDKRKVDETGGVLFTYRDLLAMEQAGILNSDEHIELLGGKIFKIMIQPPHAFTTTQLGRRFTVTFDPDCLVIQQNPLRLSDDMNDIELPQPDLMLVTQKVYVDHPRPQDVFLLIEVSDSTLKKDRQIKLPLYASVGIREVWLVNLIERVIEVYSEPVNGEYRTKVTHELTATFAPLAFPDKARQWLPESVVEVLEQKASQ